MTGTLATAAAADAQSEIPGRRRISLPLVVLLVCTAGFWLVGLGRNGWANAFYAAAVQAGTRSGKAALFGSFDAANAITVDKPPASLWPMELTARLFGMNTWAMLVPQVLIGVAAVALLYAAVARTFGTWTGLIAGALLALTPVATLMFRYNNPDALLVLLMVAAAWAVLRAVDDGRTRWLALCGATVGLGFLTKQLQVMLIVPALAGVYLVSGPPALAVRLRQLGAAAAAMVAAGGWWVALVSLTPAGDRPYIGGSTDNSFLNLTFGYNGISRLTGHRAAGQPQWHSSQWSRSHPGVLRLFTGESAGQISWLLPAALIFLVALVFWYRGRHRTDLPRAQVLLWGGWLVVSAVVFSAMTGTYHDYYTVAVAPPIAALVALGGRECWLRRADPSARVLLVFAVATTALWSFVLLSRTTDFAPGLRWVVLACGLLAVALLWPPTTAGRTALAATAAVAVLAGPVAYCIQTVSTPHHGGIVNAGPRLPAAADGHQPGGSGGMWAGMQSTDVSPTVTAMLNADASAFTWVAAAQGANRAAAYQLATGEPVLPIGGFIGRDPSPTLEQFQDDVARRRIHYFVESPRPEGGPPGADSTDSQAARITAWVKGAFTGRTIGGLTLYDLTVPVKG